MGLLGLLNATAYWRITVTNEGPVGITGTQVVDSVEPSCQQAPFALAAGTSKQVYCSTSALLNLFPIVNQAKAAYVPVNAPPGTPPSYTNWSSAKALFAAFCSGLTGLWVLRPEHPQARHPRSSAARTMLSVSIPW